MKLHLFARPVRIGGAWVGLVLRWVASRHLTGVKPHLLARRAADCAAP